MPEVEHAKAGGKLSILLSVNRLTLFNQLEQVHSSIVIQHLPSS